MDFNIFTYLETEMNILCK